MTSSFSPDLNPNKGQSRPYPRPVLDRRDLCRRKKQRQNVLLGLPISGYFSHSFH